MAKTFTTAPPTVDDMIRDVKLRYHKELADAGVTISALMVGGGLTHGGYSCNATIKINSLADRVEGKADCTMSFDGDSFDHWPPGKLEAVIGHELEHLELDKHKRGSRTGEVKTDDCGRPKLKMRLHDIVVGGFQSIIDRYGAEAVEAQALAAGVECIPESMR